MSTNLLIRLVAATCVCTASALAQNPATPRPRAVPLPDTLGANFSIADSASMKGSLTDFDFLVGTWHFLFQVRQPGGAFNAPFQGHWSATKKRTTNGFIEDHFRPDGPTVSEAGTWTYRVFNPQRQLWEMQGVTAANGAWAPGLCWTDGVSRYLVQRYGQGLVRIKYFDISDTAFSWRADRSDDGGKTWLRDYWAMRVSRIGR